MDHHLAPRVDAQGQTAPRVFAYFQESAYVERARDPAVADFAFGNPQEMPLPGFVAALQRAAEPRVKDWFAYKESEPEAQAVVAQALRDELGIPFEPADIAMTTGAFGALMAAILTMVSAGDEVIINLPPWFFYEQIVLFAGGVPVTVPVDRTTFDLDLDAVAAAITPRTRAVIVNSPNNPTGRIYPRTTLQRLAAILTAASARHGRPIYLISDEPYRRIRFDGVPFHSPLAEYPYALMTYSYAKILLTPGQRIGYLALPPTMPDRERLREAIRRVQFMALLFPNALLQHAIADLEGLAIDLGQLQAKRDRMVGALREIGYEVRPPEGTFYLLPRAPWADDVAFIRELERHDILCLPGSVVEFPGFFRISLTASAAMIERSLAGFAAAYAQARAHAPTRPVGGGMAGD